MLTALEDGVKGGVWFSLMDKVYSERNLRAAYERVRRNRGSAGVDHETLAHYARRLEEHLRRLHEGLRDGSYRPQAIRRTWIPKPGSSEKRPLGIPTVRDRVVQTALRHVLEPIFEREFADHSYGFRPGRGGKDALRRVEALLREGHTWVVDADIQGYFDSIPHEPLMERVRRRVADGRVLELVRAYLEQDILESARQWTPEQGSPQGAVISPLLSNLYLDPLDHEMAQAGYEMVRYADDFVILCRTEAEARQALDHVQRWMTEAQLTLHPTKTRIVDATQRGGFDFLGYHFERGYKWPRQKSLKKLKDAIRAKTKRTNGLSLGAIIADVNRTLQGWFEYFKHSHWTAFPDLDRWIRMRLRSLLRKRSKRKGRARGLDYIRWPNAYFAEQGLFNLAAAQATARKSLYG
jgi:RNA-directed DNA polymerase